MPQRARVAIVTGAGRGIGRAVALHLAVSGWAVVANDPGVEVDGSGGDASLVAEVVDRIKSSGGRTVASTDAVGTWEAGQALAALANEAFGPVDLLVNNAAILRDRMSFNMTAEEWLGVIQTNLNGTFFCSRAVIPSMRERRAGTIVNMISPAGLIGNPGQANYAASKGGMVGLTRVLALDLAKYGINVNAVAPWGHTRDTERVIPNTPEVAQYLEGAMTVPSEDVGPLVSFLASEAGKSITGQILGVRGKEVMLFSQPRPIKSAVKMDGWDDETLTRVFGTWRTSLTPLESDLEVFRYRPFV